MTYDPNTLVRRRRRFKKIAFDKQPNMGGGSNGIVPAPGTPGSYFGGEYYGRHFFGKRYFG